MSTELKRDWKGNYKTKGRLPSKRARHQDVGENKNVAPYKKFNVVEKGHGPHPGEKQNKGSGRELLQCWICGKDHHKKDCLLYHGGRYHIYISQEAHIVGDVGHSIPQIYASFDNKQEYHQTSIIEMEGNISIQLFLF